MVLASSIVSADREIPAFPGAEGFGSHTPGGRSGRVIEVTNLNSDGPGSLREACSAKGPRIVVFRVGGTIEISRSLSIREPFITIVGQTAPGDGICLRGGTLGVHTHDVVIRYLRVRVGDSPEGPDPENRDCIDISGDADRVYNVVIDHCSFSWSTDENVATWYGPRDVTIQWCITSESLNDSLHPKGPHGKGMILGSQDNTITIHHCLLAHNADRNPLIGDTGNNMGPSIFDFRNNVIYNHGAWVCTNVRGTSYVNYIGNVIKVGPNGLKDRPRGVRFDADAEQLFFVKDNIWPGQTEGEVDDWKILGEGRPSPERLRSARPISAPPVTTEAAADVYESVLQYAGAVLPVRDVIDERIVQEVRTGTGLIINTPEEVSGWPKYQSDAPPEDSDHDGMPDDWERQYSLDPQDAADGPETWTAMATPMWRSI
jgi:pectate lyase